MNIDPLNEQGRNAFLLCWEQLIPHFTNALHRDDGFIFAKAETLWMFLTRLPHADQMLGLLQDEMNLLKHSRMLPGTVLTRDFDDVEHKVLVLGPKDFEYRGQRFKSLSAVAKRITGCQWSGPAFFGLKTNAKEAA